MVTYVAVDYLELMYVLPIRGSPYGSVRLNRSYHSETIHNHNYPLFIYHIYRYQTVTQLL